MTSARGKELGFAAAHDTPIPYLQRIRQYYEALGYGAPYEWAHYSEVRFQPLTRPLSGSRVAIVTTAAPYQPDKGDQGPGARYNAAAKFYTVYSGDTTEDHDLRISHIAIDRKHTTAEDCATYFPLLELRKKAAAGRIASVAPRFHGAPTNRSHRVTLEVDGPEIVARCKADGVRVPAIEQSSPQGQRTGTIGQTRTLHPLPQYCRVTEWCDELGRGECARTCFARYWLASRWRSFLAARGRPSRTIRAATPSL